MRAVWSFWSKPFIAHQRDLWPSERHHLLSWILSVHTARQHYSETALFTDRLGAELLHGDLKLPFDEVRVALDDLADADDEWWTLGKLYTYQLQDKPFVHIDSDVYLWSSLPGRVSHAPVFAQNPERFDEDDNWYRPFDFQKTILDQGGWLPAEWIWYTSSQRLEAVCCGFLGGNNVDFINHYARQAIKIIITEENTYALSSSTDKIRDNILVEQYFLSACINFHNVIKPSPFEPVFASYLFDSTEAAFDPAEAKKAGYTHLISSAKRDASIMSRLEARVRRDYPAYYARLPR
jgi:hypothetical protein